MPECGNVTSSVRALGLDIGSTHVKAVVVGLDERMRELAVAQRPVSGLGGRALVDAALDAAREVLREAGPVAVIGIASMAETGALIGPDGVPGALVRWDRSGDQAARLALGGGLDPITLHAATGTPLVAKLPLLTWAALAVEGIPADARWAFAADLVAAALTGRIATDHSLAGRSGAYRLPDPKDPPGTEWDDGLLGAIGVARRLLPEILLPGQPVGTVRDLPGAAGAAVHIAGHDHAVAAWLAGVDRPGRVVHSLGTTEAVIALAERPVDRARAAAEGISVVRAVDGLREGVLAGSPAAGALIAQWRERALAAGADADALLAARGGTGSALALPYPRGRQAPAPDPAAEYVLLGGDPDDPAVELSGILRGLAAHGAWMREVVAGLASTPTRQVAAVGTPVRSNPRLAALMGSLADGPLAVVDLAAPVAAGAAALAAERAGLAPRASAPIAHIEPDDDGMPDLADHFARAVKATRQVPQGAP